MALSYPAAMAGTIAGDYLFAGETANDMLHGRYRRQQDLADKSALQAKIANSWFGSPVKHALALMGDKSYDQSDIAAMNEGISGYMTQGADWLADKTGLDKDVLENVAPDIGMVAPAVGGAALGRMWRAGSNLAGRALDKSGKPTAEENARAALEGVSNPEHNPASASYKGRADYDGNRANPQVSTTPDNAGNQSHRAYTNPWDTHDPGEPVHDSNIPNPETAKAQGPQPPQGQGGQGINQTAQAAEPAQNATQNSKEQVRAAQGFSRAHGGGGLPENAEPVFDYRSDQQIKSHPDYRAAKGGDVEAAARMVRDTVKPESLEASRKLGPDVIYVPIHAEEAVGRNKIPGALAMEHARAAGARVAMNIVQTNRASHTGAGPMERIMHRAEFAGKVEPGQRYVLVDDVTTMGSTLADLAAYIQSNGGKVEGSRLLVNAARSGKITASPKVIKQLEARHGQAIRDTVGITPDQLTAPESQYLYNFRSADELRNRSIKAGFERVARLSAKEILSQRAAGVDDTAAPAQRTQAAAQAALKNPVAPSPVFRAMGSPARVATGAGRAVDTHWAIADADELITSHDTALRADARYPQALQPRQRERAASEAQVNDMARNLDPQRLGYSAEAPTGAPIAGPDGIVESGNGRAIAIKRVYQQASAKAGEYRNWVRDNATQFGLKPDQVAAVKKPVLVRVRDTPMDMNERARFAQESNYSPTAAMSSTETARADAQNMGSLENLRPDENGDFNNAASQPFVRQFVQSVPQAERGALMDANGALSQAGHARIRAAVLARAYGDSPILARITESLDDNTRNISKALLLAAPEAAKMEDAMRAGTRWPVGIAQELSEAANQVSRLREQGLPVPDALRQGSLLGEEYPPAVRQIMQAMHEWRRSPNKLGDFIKNYYRLADEAGDPRQMDMLGTAHAPDKLETIDRAIAQTKAGGQDDIFQREQAGNSPGSGGIGNDARGAVRSMAAQLVKPENIRDTQAFIRGEAIAEAKADALNAAPGELASGKATRARVVKWFRDNGITQAVRPGLGVVAIGPRNIAQSLWHGYWRGKLAAFTVLRDVIEGGRVLHAELNYQGDPHDRVVIGAPVKIGGKDYLMGVMLKADANGTSFYLHEVTLSSKDKPRLPHDMRPRDDDVEYRGQPGFVSSVLQNAYEGKSPVLEQAVTAIRRAQSGGGLGGKQGGAADPRFLLTTALIAGGAAAGWYLGRATNEQLEGLILGGSLAAAARLLPGYAAKAALTNHRLLTLGATTAGGMALGAYLDKKHPLEGAFLGLAYGAAGLLPRAKLPVAAKLLGKDGHAPLTVDDIVNARNGTIAVRDYKSIFLKQAALRLLPDAADRDAVMRAIDAGQAGKLTGHKKTVADAWLKFSGEYAQAAKDAGLLNNFVSNYITHRVVEITGNAPAAGAMQQILDRVFEQTPAAGGARTTSNFSKARKYPTVGELERALAGTGLKVDTDIANLFEAYGKSMGRAIENRLMIDALKSAEIGGAVEGAAGRGGKAAKFLMPAEEAPSGYVTVNAPQLIGYRAHPQIAPALKFVMERHDPGAIMHGIGALNRAAKQLSLSGSLFHANNLMFAFGAATGAHGAGQILRGAGRAITRRGGIPAVDATLKDLRENGLGPDMETLMVGGLGLSAPEDINMDAASKLGAAVDGLVERATGVDPHLRVAGKAPDALNNLTQKVTWNYVHTGLKAHTALKLFNDQLLKHPEMSREEVAKGVAAFVNHAYGGLDWYREATQFREGALRDAALNAYSPSGRRVMQLLTFAPDWTLSTLRMAFDALPGSSAHPITQSLARAYYLRTAAIYLIGMNAANKALSGHWIWQNQNPAMIELPNGSRLQMNKHGLEPVEWLHDPMNTTASKLGWLPKEALEQILGKEYISANYSPPMKESHIGHLLADFVPIGLKQGASGRSFGAGVVRGAVSSAGFPVYGMSDAEKQYARLQARAKRRQAMKARGHKKKKVDF
jgi:hypothetical protein